MKKWRIHRNYRRYKNNDKIINIIEVYGKKIEVNDDIFFAYAQADRKERYIYDNKEKLQSYEQIIENESFFDKKAYKEYFTKQYTYSDDDILEIVFDEISKLSEDEKDMIQKIYFDGISISQYAHNKGLSHSTISYRKNRVIEKIRKNILKFIDKGL